MSRLEKLMRKSNLDISLLGAALNISDEKMRNIIENDRLDLLEDIMLGEMARVLGIDEESLVDGYL